MSEARAGVGGPWRRTVLLAVLAVSLCACQATVRVAVTPRANGSGDLSVALVLDRQAAAFVGDLGSAVATADLQKAGWVVDKPVATSGGGASETAHHPFRTVAEANALIASLAGTGANVPFHVALTHRSGTLSSEVAVSGDIDLTAGADAFADDKLRQALGAPSLAAALDQARANGAAVPQVDAQLVVTFPGRPSHVAGGRISGNAVTWAVPLGQRASIGARARVADSFAETWLLVAAGLVAAFLIVAGIEFRRRNEWHFGDGRGRAVPRSRGPGLGGRNRGHQDRWSLPTGPGSRR